MSDYFDLTLNKNYEDYWIKLKNSAKCHPANRFRYWLIRETLKTKLKKGDNIVDMGCGDAQLLSHLKAVFPNNSFFGVDISSTVVSLNQSKETGIKFYCADVSSNNFFNNIPIELVSKVNVVISSEVIEHLENDKGLLINSFKLLKPGGYLLITTQSGPRYRIDIELLHHLRHYNRWELETMIQEAGFKTLKSFNCGFPVLTLQKKVTNWLYDAVISKVASSEKPTFWVRCIMSVMFFLMKKTPRFLGGPQILILAQKPED